jgi:hypothetical protein
MTSPFDWKNTPSSFSKLRAYNGIDARASRIASTNAKNTITLPGSSKPKKVKYVAQSSKSALQ